MSQSVGELIIEARKKAQKSASKTATVEMKDCTCSVTVSIFSAGSYFRYGEPITPPEGSSVGGSSERYEKCHDHEDRPRVLVARGSR